MEKKTKEEILDGVLGPIRKKMHTELQMDEIKLAMQRFANQEKAALVEALTAVMPYIDGLQLGNCIDIINKTGEDKGLTDAWKKAKSALKTEKA